MSQLTNFKGLLLLGIIAVLFCTILPTNGQGRLIHGKFFGKLNTVLNPDRKEHKDVKNYWITQPVDHFNHKDKRNWQQRYFKNDTLFQEKGPICILIGGESAAATHFVYDGGMVDQCSKLNGVLYELEHRFYGQSRPLGDASVESLRYLTIHQALEDIANFIKTIKSDDSRLKCSKVVLYGGSYSATLVAYFLEKYPHLAAAGIASSAPINWKYDFKEYLEVVGNVIKQTSKTCYSTIQNGINHLPKILSNLQKNPDADSIAAFEPLKLCTRPDISNDLEIQNLYSAFSGQMSYFVQYSGVVNFGIRDVCNFTDNLSSSLTDYEKFAITSNTINSMFGSNCIDYNYTETCEYLAAEGWDSVGVISGGRMWTWQVCTEVASFQSTTSHSQPFANVPTSLFASQCKCAFGKKYNEAFIRQGLAKHLASFGSFEAPRKNVVFINGRNDPWSSIGVTSYGKLPTSSKFNYVFLIKGGSHCNDVYSARATDSKYLTKARAQTAKYINKLLDNGESAPDCNHAN